MLMSLPIYTLLFTSFLPASVFLATFAAGKASDVHHEDPRQCVEGHSFRLYDRSSTGGREHCFKHGAADANAHNPKEQNEQEVDGVPCQAVILACTLQKPPRLQQRIGNLAPKEHSTGLTTRFPKSQCHKHAQDTQSMMGEHQRALCSEEYAPAHVKHEVTQTDQQGQDLQWRTLCACGNEM